MRVMCPYCNRETNLIAGKRLYPHKPKLHNKLYYQCGICKAHVGCHKGTDRPLGTPATGILRSKRSQAHRCFDKLWKSNTSLSRRQAYINLARVLKINLSDCHIGMFNYNQCCKTIEYAVSQRGEGM